MNIGNIFGKRILRICLLGLFFLALIFLSHFKVKHLLPKKISAISASLNPSGDSYIQMDDAGTPIDEGALNYGTAPLIAVGKASVEWIRKGFIKFDLSSIPQGSTVNSASLRLYVEGWGGENGWVAFYKVTENWQELEITWNNQPGVDTSAQIVSVYLDSVDYFINLDVKNIVQQWVSGTTQNYGLMFTSTTANRWWYFDSKENSEHNPSWPYWPLLTIDYTPPPPTVTPTLPPAGPFFQIKNCDVYANGRLRSIIPTTVPLLSRYFINSSPGGVVYSTFPLGIDLGSALAVSPDSDWRLEGYPQAIDSLSFNRLKTLAKLLFLDEEKEFDPAETELKDLSSGIWYTLSDLEIDSLQEISGGKKLLIFVGKNKDGEEKDLKINANITVLAGDNSMIMFAVSKNILIDPRVTLLHGIYYAAGLGESDPDYRGIHTGTNKDKVPPENDQPLEVIGNLVVGPEANIKLERDLGPVANQTTAAEVISCQAKYFVFFSPVLRSPIISWQEVIP